MVCGMQCTVNNGGWQAKQGGVLRKAPHPDGWVIWHVPEGTDHRGVGVEQVGVIHVNVVQIGRQCRMEQGSIVCRAPSAGRGQWGPLPQLMPACSGYIPKILEGLICLKCVQVLIEVPCNDGRCRGQLRALQRCPKEKGVALLVVKPIAGEPIQGQDPRFIQGQDPNPEP